MIEQEKWDEAELLSKELLKLEPKNLEGLLNLGICRLNKNDPVSALNAFTLATISNPQSAIAWANKGSLLLDQLELNEAQNCLANALQIDPNCEAALIGMGNLCNEKKLYEEAICHFSNVLRLNPKNQEATWNKALSLLRLGRFEEGWPLYEARWSIKGMKNNLRQLPKPLWLGQQPLLGKTIFIYCEQGFGDAIQMSRYLPLLEKELGTTVIFETPECLAELMGSLSPSIKVIQQGAYSDSEIAKEVDFQCPIMSLPLAFSTTLQNIPNQTPYLSSIPSKLVYWSNLLKAASKSHHGSDLAPFRIGVTWSGSGHYAGKINTKRDLPFSNVESLLGMFSHLPIEFHAIQKNTSKLPSSVTGKLFVHDVKLQNFSDTAALMSNLDLILTIDTAVGHLAGALGLNTILLIPDPPDFMSLTDTHRSPWYPNSILLRQPNRGNWSLDDIKITIESYILKKI